MWNKEGTPILVFLTQEIKDLEALRYELAQQVLTDTPGVGRISSFIHRLSKVRELLPACSRLRDKISMAIMDKKSLVLVIAEERTTLMEAAVEYSAMGLGSEAEHYAKLALMTFANALAEFTPEQPQAAA